MATKLQSVWTDDHLPCVSFYHNNNYFEVWWTDPALGGKIEMVEEGDVSIEKAFKKYPELLKIVLDPTNEETKEWLDDEEDDYDGDKVSWCTPVGMVSWFKNGNPDRG
jgi:hypothetical protein